VIPRMGVLRFSNEHLGCCDREESLATANNNHCRRARNGG
jgi:hypothetical protein